MGAMKTIQVRDVPRSSRAPSRRMIVAASVPDLLDRLVDQEIHAPHLVDVEVLNGLRGLGLRGEGCRSD